MSRAVASEPEFARLEREFAAYLRDPERSVPPGAHDDRRLAIYRHAVFSNIERFMRDNYPRVLAVMSAQEWQAMVRDYVIRHAATATAFVDLPREFLLYLEHQHAPDPARPFLGELAHFDWLETLVSADRRILDLSTVERAGDVIAGIPVANPIMTLVTYRYPVHVITSAYQPLEAPAVATRIAAFRAPDNEYGFLDLNEPAARLLELVMAAGGHSGREILAGVASELGQADVSALIAAGRTILTRMQVQGAILGTARV